MPFLAPPLKIVMNSLKIRLKYQNTHYLTVGYVEFGSEFLTQTLEFFS